MKVTYVADHRPSFLDSKILHFQHLTISEYRTSVGDKEFAIETDFHNPLQL